MPWVRAVRRLTTIILVLNGLVLAISEGQAGYVFVYDKLSSLFAAGPSIKNIQVPNYTVAGDAVNLLGTLVVLRRADNRYEGQVLIDYVRVNQLPSTNPRPEFSLSFYAGSTLLENVRVFDLWSDCSASAGRNAKFNFSIDQTIFEKTTKAIWRDKSPPYGRC